MDKILLVGNGLTLHLIPDYKNDNMMPRVKNSAPEIFEKANMLFEPFRKSVEHLQYAAVGWGYSGDAFCGMPSAYGPICDLVFDKRLLAYIEKTLQNYGFDDPSSKVSSYFQTYGLIHETQKAQISNLESLLKVISLFHLLGRFSVEEKDELIQRANTIYYNNGNCGQASLSMEIRKNLREWLSTYKMIFTTNYDCLLDEILQTDQIQHLHGGFFYKDKSYRCDSIVPKEEAILVWGISGEEKENNMAAAANSATSIFETYLSNLRTVQAEQIDIFGYSGENDQHINRAIAENSSIKEIHYFCASDKVSSEIEKFQLSSRFFIGSSNPSKRLILKSRDTIWNAIEPV